LTLDTDRKNVFSNPIAFWEHHKTLGHPGSDPMPGDDEDEEETDNSDDENDE
jgi:hypothetical protein